MNSLFIYGRLYDNDNGNIYEIMKYYPLKEHYTHDIERYKQGVKNKLISMARNYNIKHFSVLINQATEKDYISYYKMKEIYDI